MNCFLTRDIRWTKCERENTFEFIFTTVYWGEKIYVNLFSLPFIGGGGEKIYLNLFSLPFIGGRKIFKFIFTPVCWGEKINLNSFSLPFIEEKKYI